MRFHEEAERDAYDAIVVGAGSAGSPPRRCSRAPERACSWSSDTTARAATPTPSAGAATTSTRRCTWWGAASRAPSRRAPCCTACSRRWACASTATSCAWIPATASSGRASRSRRRRTSSASSRRTSSSFPREAKGIRGFVEDCLTIRSEASRAEEGASVVTRPERFPLLLRYRRATLAQVLEDRIEDPARARRAGGAVALPRASARRASPSCTSPRC